jgi:hypothetical protein
MKSKSHVKIDFSIPNYLIILFVFFQKFMDIVFQLPVNIVFVGRLNLLNFKSEIKSSANANIFTLDILLVNVDNSQMVKIGSTFNNGHVINVLF